MALNVVRCYFLTQAPALIPFDQLTLKAPTRLVRQPSNDVVSEVCHA